MKEKTPRSTSKERQLTLLDGAIATTLDPESILYAHTVLCQTGLPYRNPGHNVRRWERTNGNIGLQINAGDAWHPEENRFVPLGLPYGPKPRLLLAHLNAEAIKQKSPEIEVERSLTAFVQAINLDPKGRNITAIKDQLSRLSAATIRFGISKAGESVTINTGIVSQFSLWFPKDERQRVLWPSTVKLSVDYFESLQRHAVPLHDQALAALSGSAMALDVYCWLAQRLHRIHPKSNVFISWPALQMQFGWHYDRIRDFRRVFTHTVRLVHSQYQTADFDLNEQGMTLRNSSPPIKPKSIAVCLP
jgi:hypothetical protein